jgi:hypothetical protein
MMDGKGGLITAAAKLVTQAAAKVHLRGNSRFSGRQMRVNKVGDAVKIWTPTRR